MMPPGVTDVLEIGCGQGALGARLSARYSTSAWSPIRILRRGRGPFARIEGGEVRNASVATLGPEDRFDLVCAFEVLEHIEDDQNALIQWTAHLRPGGWLLISVPAHQRRYAAADELVGPLPAI